MEEEMEEEIEQGMMKGGRGEEKRSWRRHLDARQGGDEGLGHRVGHQADQRRPQRRRRRLRRRPHPQAEGTALRQPVLDHHLHAVGRHRFISWKLRSSPVRAANTPTQLVGFRPQRASFSQDALKV